jgi:uncharacterized membrane protein YphA (DoxX/SURF4 family)
MNSYNDLLVASIALVGSASALAAAIGPWQHPYRLRSIEHVVDRFGMPVARCVWILIAVVSLVAAVAIASGIRPGYAKPDQGLTAPAR